MFVSIVAALFVTVAMLACAMTVFIIAAGILVNPHPKFSENDRKFRDIKPVKTQSLFECSVV